LLNTLEPQVKLGGLYLGASLITEGIVFPQEFGFPGCNTRDFYFGRIFPRGFLSSGRL